MGICGILFVIFLLCKIFGVAPIVNWNWWLVCSPIIVEVVFDTIISTLFWRKTKR